MEATRSEKQPKDAGADTCAAQTAAPDTAYIYILRCGDGSLYTGWTNDLEKRLQSHQSGRGAKYTKSHRPVTLVYSEAFDTREAAMRREWEIKQLTKAQKEALVHGGGERSGQGHAADTATRKRKEADG